MRLLRVLAPILLMATAWGQGIRYQNQIIDSNGKPVRSATIRVCQEPATSTPCTPLAPGGIFNDRGLQVPIANPFTSDSNGNYYFYANPGRYQVQVSGTTISTYTTADIILWDPNFSFATFATKTFSATPAFDASLASFYQITLTGNVTSSSITNGNSAGQLLWLKVCQDGTGGKTFVWPTNFTRPPPVVSLANACTVHPVVYDGTNWVPHAFDSFSLNSTGTITNGSANLSLPNATDTLVGRISTDTLSNKTIDLNGLQFAGSTSGTTIVKAAAIASGTITVPAASDTLVGKATTDILTNKTLTSPTINNPTVSTGTFNTPALTTPAVGSAGATFAGSSSGTTVLKAAATASGTVTIPATTDTLVGKATADVLTNKTLDTAGAGNVFKINGTTISAVTGSGSATLATSPTIGTPTITGTIPTYNSITTAGQGFAVIPCVTSQKAESAADTNVLTCTPPAAVGSYRIRFSEDVSAANTATLGWTATWTDSNAHAQAPTNLSLLKAGTAAPALTFSGAANDHYYGYIDIDTDNSGTAIVVKLTFAGTSFASKTTASVERIN